MPAARHNVLWTSAGNAIFHACEVCGVRTPEGVDRCEEHTNLTNCHNCHRYVPAAEIVVSRSVQVCTICMGASGRRCYLCKQPAWHTSAVTHRRWMVCDKCREGYSQCHDCGTWLPGGDLVKMGSSTARFCAFCYGRRSTNADPGSVLVAGSTRRFGYELEFCHPTDGIDKLFRFGMVKADGSVSNSIGSGAEAYEFASPPVAGDKGFAHIDEVSNLLMRGQVNSSCGFHAHLSVEASTITQRQNIQNWWRVMETLFFAYVPSHRWSNNYCRAVRDIPIQEWPRNRYMALNIASASKWGTFECRLHEGTLSAKAIKTWMLILLRFFDTFGDIESTGPRVRKVALLNDRDRLQFMFMQCKLPLSVRQYFLRRINASRQPFISLQKAHKKGAYLNV
jgi:hypothetical protein